MINLKAEHILRIQVTCAEEMVVGGTPEGTLRVIPIVGGDFSGKISGKVVAGGADWNITRQNDIGYVFAKYLLQADNGEYIAIENKGNIDMENDQIVIKTAPNFMVDQNSTYRWLNSGVYVGSLESGIQRNQVIINIYRMN